MRENIMKRFKLISVFVAIILIIIALVFGVSKLVLKHNENDKAIQFNEYKVQQQEITHTPETYTGGTVTVTVSPSILSVVNSGKTGADVMKLQYQITDLNVSPSSIDSAWTDYTVPIVINQNSKVSTRLVTRGHTDASLEMDYTSPVTSVDITNIAVAQIGNTTYKTLGGATGAIAAWGNLTTQEKQTSTIEMLANTSENITIPQTEEIKIDLCGYNIIGASSSAPTITVNGILNLRDSGKTANNVTTYGKVESTANTAIVVTGANSELVLGTNESAGGINSEVVNVNGPTINGGTGSNGVVVEQGGNLEFYDGTITAPLQSGTNTAIVVNNTAVGNANTNLVTVPTGYRLDLSDDTTLGKEIATVIRQLTVSFDSNGGTPSNIADIEVGEGKAYNKYAQWPANPTREGYSFGGWDARDENANQPEIVSASTTVTQTQNHTLTAIWEANNYTIAFDANGGTGTMTDQPMVYDVSENITTNTFTRTGYKFVGWNTAADGSGTAYIDGQSVQNLTNVNGGVVSLYAQWEANTYTVVFNTNTLPSEYQEVEYIESHGSQYIDTGVKPSNTLTTDLVYMDTAATGSNYVLGSRTGETGSSIHYGLVGNAADLSIRAYFCSQNGDDGAIYTISRVANKMYHANLSIEYDNLNGYRMHSVLDDLNTDTNYEVYTAYSADGINFEVPNIYVFAIKNNNIHQGMRLYSLKFWDDGVLIRDFIPCYRTSDDVAGLYDLVTQEFYTYSGFTAGTDTNTVTVSNILENQLMTYDTSVNLPTTGLTKTGYVFGWNTAADGSGTAYTDGQSVQNLTSVDGGTVNLYAQWQQPMMMNSLQQSSPRLQMSNPGLQINSTQNNVNVSENLNNGEESNNTSNNEQQQESEASNVAQIGNTEYATISEAISNASNGNTIKILEDVELSEEIVVPTGKNITINLNGKTITSEATNTINNQGTLTIKGTGIIKNEVENGTVVYNTGTLNVENGIITTAENGGKCINNSSNVNIKGGKLVTEGIGAIGLYNVGNGKAEITGGIFETRNYGSKTIYNDSELEMEDAKVIVSDYDSIGIYNGKQAKSNVIKDTEIVIEAEEIENYELIKNTNEFQEYLNGLKSSYGIYNDDNSEVIIETATIKAERLKSVGIYNATIGTITLGVDESEEGNEVDVDTASPIIYAISDNTTAIINSQNGNINFYDGRVLTTSTIKNIITRILTNYEIYEELNSNIINATLRLIASEVEIDSGDSNSEEIGENDSSDEMESAENENI